MLSRGFKDQIYYIIKSLPTSCKIGLFSATMPSEMFDLTQKFMRDPINILVKRDSLTLDGIKQYYVKLNRQEFKSRCVIRFISLYSSCQAMIIVMKRVDCFKELTIMVLQ